MDGFERERSSIALVQLYVWLTEMILYRLNQVPAKNYLKFLELVGIQLDPPAPARAELTFTLTSKDLPNPIQIPGGTQVSLAQSSSGAPVIFETDDDLYAVGAALTAVQTFDSATYQIQTEANGVDGKYYYASVQIHNGPRPCTWGSTGLFRQGPIEWECWRMLIRAILLLKGREWQLMCPRPRRP